MASSEHARANARSAVQVAEAKANADAANIRELQRELQRVEVQSEAAQARLAERARQEVALVQN
eukprot:10581603-Alexandrium_andersonii.AAC.1